MAKNILVVHTDEVEVKAPSIDSKQFRVINVTGKNVKGIEAYKALQIDTVKMMSECNCNEEVTAMYEKTLSGLNINKVHKSLKDKNRDTILLCTVLQYEPLKAFIASKEN